MITGYMQVDLNNPLAVKYMDYCLKSFEPVSDIFKIEVVQCVTPDTLLPELENIPNKDARSPQELASLHSNYRFLKRSVETKERFWLLEHDAYLRPEHEDVFRMIMSKWITMPTACIGMSNEFYTCRPEVAKVYCDLVESGTRRNALGVLHLATDLWVRRVKHRRNTIYWPCNWSKDIRWVNTTGVGMSCSEAYNDPAVILNSPITQAVDLKYGGTVVDRKKAQRNGVFDPSTIYTREKHPDVHWIDLDNL